ncbi:hypothetical protein [Niabella hirudinis]|uniref:hypothetical protein n=1 Tax=Niabella hirudinis TaxID=1285929 RepID=UPI003EB8A365
MTEPVLENAEPSYNNLTYLKELLGNDASAINDILREIKLQWKEDQLHLGQALALEDLSEVKRLLHRIKSTFSPLGPGHVLYLEVVNKGEAFLEKEENFDGAADYWQNFIGDIEQMVGDLPLHI